MPARLTAHQPAERESAKFVLLPEAGDHSVALFALPDGELTDRSTPLCPSNVPRPSESFVGRQHQIRQAVGALIGSRWRCVCLVGAGGIGKTALSVPDAVKSRDSITDHHHRELRIRRYVIAALSDQPRAVALGQPID